MEKIVLGLGSNKADHIGRDSESLLTGGIACLEEILSGFCAASLFETAPLHITDQNYFLNTAVSGFYEGSPEELLSVIQNIEAKHGRNRANERRFGERTLDIDILLFGDLVLQTPILEIPHTRLRERAFALIPLLELLPDAKDPRTGELYRDILNRLPDQEVRRFHKGGSCG